MVRRKKSKVKSEKTAKASAKCLCGECTEPHAKLPGYLLIAFGLLTLPVNFGLVPELEWARAWPLLLVMFGFVLLAKVVICKAKS